MAARSKTLGGGLAIRAVRDSGEARLWVAFNGENNNASEGATCECLVSHHPGMSLDDFWMVEDEANGVMAATICRIPWTLKLDGIELKASMLEMVLSHRDYRGKGLIRAMMDEFLRAAVQDGSELCIIWGIPFYYRQFGYSYAVAGDQTLELDLAGPQATAALARAAAAPAPAAVLARAAGSDAGALAAMRDRAMRGLGLYAARDASFWRYLIEDARFDVRLLKGSDGLDSGSGYAILKRSADDLARVAVTEDGIADEAAALACLAALKAEGCDKLAIADSPASALAALARKLGAVTKRGGQWLWRAPDWARLLGALGPAFERRLAASGEAGRSFEFRINLFREAFALRFEAGKFASAAALGFVDSSMGADGGDLLVPTEAFVRLVTGFKGIEELYDAWPDTVVKAGSEGLAKALFPKLEAFVHLPYHFQG